MDLEPERINLLDLSREWLVEWLTGRGIAAYRAGQVLTWVYRRQADDFNAMSDLGKELRALLSQQFRIPRLAILARQASADGTSKYLFGLEDGERIETVLIPERDHFTLCVSSQVGCAQNCRFCLTAKGRLRRNLTGGEILAQVRDVRQELPDPAQLTNIVFMGMGEPLANLDNLLAALALITDSGIGLGFAARRVTVSTAGLVPQMLEFGRRSRVCLAVSLNAADDETRSRLMPINRTYPLEALLEACRSYPLPPGRRITFSGQQRKPSWPSRRCCCASISPSSSATARGRTSRPRAGSCAPARRLSGGPGCLCVFLLSSRSFPCYIISLRTSSGNTAMT